MTPPITLTQSLRMEAAAANASASRLNETDLWKEAMTVLAFKMTAAADEIERLQAALDAASPMVVGKVFGLKGDARQELEVALVIYQYPEATIEVVLP